jgi:hypothetical protein
VRRSSTSASAATAARRLDTNLAPEGYPCRRRNGNASAKEERVPPRIGEDRSQEFDRVCMRRHVNLAASSRHFSHAWVRSAALASAFAGNVSRIGTIQRNRPLQRAKILARAAYPQDRSANANSLWLRVWPIRRDLSRHFKYMARGRIPEFESYHPSHAVIISAVMTRSLRRRSRSRARNALSKFGIIRHHWHGYQFCSMSGNVSRGNPSAIARSGGPEANLRSQTNGLTNETAMPSGSPATSNMRTAFKLAGSSTCTRSAIVAAT